MGRHAGDAGARGSGRAVGWALAFFAATVALEGLWTVLRGRGRGGGRSDGGGAATGPPPWIVVALVVFGVTRRRPRSRRSSRIRGYLFAALTNVARALACGGDHRPAVGAAHVAVYPPEMLPALAFFGVAACLLFWFTGSLLPVIAVHAFNNAIAMGAWPAGAGRSRC